MAEVGDKYRQVLWFCEGWISFAAKQLQRGEKKELDQNNSNREPTFS